MGRFGGCQSLAEKIVGLIQRVTLSQLGVHVYDLLLTDQRLILLRTPRPKSELSPFTKEYLKHSFQDINPYAALVNTVIRQDPNECERRMTAYQERDPDELVRTEKSIPISYSSMKDVEFQSGFNGSFILVRYSSPSGENEEFKIRLDPLADMSARVRFPREAIEGVNEAGDYAHFTKETNDEICRQTDAAKEEYFQSVKRLLLSCLPNNLRLNSKGFF